MRAILSGKRDSNSRPQPWQGCALPTELLPQILKLLRRFRPKELQIYNDLYSIQPFQAIFFTFFINILNPLDNQGVAFTFSIPKF